MQNYVNLEVGWSYLQTLRQKLKSTQFKFWRVMAASMLQYENENSMWNKMIENEQWPESPFLDINISKILGYERYMSRITHKVCY